MLSTTITFAVSYLFHRQHDVTLLLTLPLIPLFPVPPTLSPTLFLYLSLLPLSLLILLPPLLSLHISPLLPSTFASHLPPPPLSPLLTSPSLTGGRRIRRPSLLYAAQHQTESSGKYCTVLPLRCVRAVCPE